MSINSIPLTAENLAECVPLWGDYRAYTTTEFTTAMETAKALLSEERARGALILEDGRVRGFGVSVFADRGHLDESLAAPQAQLGKRLLLGESRANGAILD